LASWQVVICTPAYELIFIINVYFLILLFMYLDFFNSCFPFQIMTDSFLRMKSDPSGNVFAIGDCADIDGTPLPCTAQVSEDDDVDD
jgi:hypothetical protein